MSRKSMVLREELWKLAKGSAICLCLEFATVSFDFFFKSQTNRMIKAKRGSFVPDPIFQRKFWILTGFFFKDETREFPAQFLLHLLCESRSV
jgi:hypothetical protein